MHARRVADRNRRSGWTRGEGASRLQEVLADRWAVNAYGSKAFRKGFRHVIKRSVAFDAHIERSVSDATDLKRGWANLYTYRPSKPVVDDELDEKYREVLDAEASAYDSHPRRATGSRRPRR